MQLATNQQLSSATDGLSSGGRIENILVSDPCFYTNDVFILEGFQSNQMTAALILIRLNRTFAGGKDGGERR